MDITKVRAPSRDAREHYASAEAAEIFLAVALLTASPLSRAVGNFFLGLNKARVPTPSLHVEGRRRCVAPRARAIRLEEAAGALSAGPRRSY